MRWCREYAAFLLTTNALDFFPYRYETTIVEGNIVKPVETKMQFRTERKVPKVRTCEMLDSTVYGRLRVLEG